MPGENSPQASLRPKGLGFVKDLLAVGLEIEICLLRRHALEHDCLDRVPEQGEMPQMRRIIYRVDPRAIVTVSTYEEAFGEGFQKPAA